MPHESVKNIFPVVLKPFTNKRYYGCLSPQVQQRVVIQETWKWRWLSQLRWELFHPRVKHPKAGNVMQPSGKYEKDFKTRFSITQLKSGFLVEQRQDISALNPVICEKTDFCYTIENLVSNYTQICRKMKRVAWHSLILNAWNWDRISPSWTETLAFMSARFSSLFYRNWISPPQFSFHNTCKSYADKKP